MRERVEAIEIVAVAARGEIAVAIVEPGEALVEARKLAGEIVDRLALEAVLVLRGKIEGPAGELRHGFGGIARPAIGIGKERRRLVLHDVANDLVAILVSVHRMEDVAGIALEPADRCDTRRCAA